jgi:hypothetical protein
VTSGDSSSDVGDTGTNLQRSPCDWGPKLVSLPVGPSAVVWSFACVIATLQVIEKPAKMASSARLNMGSKIAGRICGAGAGLEQEQGKRRDKPVWSRE